MLTKAIIGAIALLALVLAGASCSVDSSPPGNADSRSASSTADAARPSHQDEVMTSAWCSTCHPAIYAENAQNTHGRAFFDPEARAATRGFRRDDCVRCHTPRPVAENGIGLTPMQRWTDLEEGNNCMSCHWKADYDYARFQGGRECKTAFDPRVGTVQACASCHRIGGTPDQWSRAEHGLLAGNVCIDCHMPLVDRPVAVGEPPRAVRSHVFPASRSDSQLHRAESYTATIIGNEVVVRITNRGVGHNFPTASRQRAVESVVTVRDEDGKVIGTSRLICRYPYAQELAPGQLTMPVSTQIPSGKFREQRVPLPIARGTVECELFFKLYRPIEDHHPTLSHRLEDVKLGFAIAEPSKDEIKDSPEVGFPAPPASLEDFFSPTGYSNVARPAPGSGPVEIPEGKNPAELARLVSLLEFHMPEARERARERLSALGAAAAPALIDAMGDWSNETYNQAMDVLAGLGEPAVPSLRAALARPELYIRCHARLVLGRIRSATVGPAVRDDLVAGLTSRQALDRRSAAEALGMIGDPVAAPALRPLLRDEDWDVVMAAAESLARMNDREAAPLIASALKRAGWLEARRALGRALCELGDPSGAPVLLDGLAHADGLTRSLFFEAFFAVTGMHEGFDAELPDLPRLESLARLRNAWEEHGGAAHLRRVRRVDEATRAHTEKLVVYLGGGSDTEPGGDDAALMDELAKLGPDAVPALVDGLTYPTGWSVKRARVCEVLSRIRSKDAVPALIGALRDPVLPVADWACWALDQTGDPDALPALVRYEARVIGVRSDPVHAAESDRLLARVARARLTLGDAGGRQTLINLLLSDSQPAREIAIQALFDHDGDRRGYDPAAPAAERLEAARRWQR